MKAKAYIVHQVMCEPELEWSKPKDCLSAEPLYTTPPPVAEPHKRPSRSDIKPLTEQEIGAILEDINAFGTRLYTFARAIEAAHGIKGEA